MKKISEALKGIVQQLNDLSCHSGSELGEKTGISRNAVWKYIKVLNEYGVAISSIQSMGYQLDQPLILLDDKLIKKQVKNLPAFKIGKLEILADISSTNDYLKKQSAKEKQLSVCLAEYQNAGKGRLGRKWVSPFGANIYFSALWQVHKDMSDLSGLGLVVALSTVSALKKAGVQSDLSIKWPNDVYWQGKKLAGILIEVQAESHGQTRIIIGIGINTNLSANVSKQIDQPFASLDKILNQYINRNELVALLISELLIYLEKFDRENFTSFMKEWRAHDYLQDQVIQLAVGDKVYSGLAQGVNQYGNLLLQTKDDNIHAYSAGDASVKKRSS